MVERGTIYTNANGKTVKVEAVRGDWAAIAIRNAPRQLARSLKKIVDIEAEIAVSPSVHQPRRAK